MGRLGQIQARQDKLIRVVMQRPCTSASSWLGRGRWKQSEIADLVLAGVEADVIAKLEDAG